MEDFNYKPLISIIIPVYNTAEYLRQCLDSIINQSYKNIEIICINDCSTDNSFEILKKYSDTDNRIILLNNEENIGAGLSRNKGLEIAKGEYVFFVDSDDWLETEACFNFIKILNKYGKVDLISFKLKNIDSKSGKIYSAPTIPENIEHKIVNIYTCPECIEHVQEAVSKLINTKFLRNNDIIYKEYKSLEDVEYAVDIMINAKSIIFTNDLVYNYRTNRIGSVVSKCDHFINAIVKAVNKADNASKDFPKDIRNKLMSKLYRTLLYSAYTSYYHKVLSFAELKAIFENNIDINVLKDEKLYFYLDLCNKVKHYSPLHFRIITTFKLFIKEAFPLAYNTYMNLKKRICRHAKS